MKKKDYRNLIILEVIAIVMILFLTRGEFVFGSKVDWPYQHFYFADYFRKLFYETGNFFPNFAFHLGNGQNIFYFSYYGLYSPIFLLSYFVPFIPMGTFIQQAMAVLVILCTLFYYKWVRRRFDSTVSFILSLLFLTASPILFHASRHIMFISYMPFILLGLYGVDAYFEKQSIKSKIMLASSVLGIILSNYFFSIVGICTIVLYGMFVCLEKYECRWNVFFNKMMKFIVPFLYGVLLSMFFVLPTLYAIANGRVKTNVEMDIVKLLIPNLNLSSILYSSYNYGIGLLFLFSLVQVIFSKNKSLKFLTGFIALISFIPIFIYILNGFMYVEYKILIPLLPLLGIIIGYFLQDLQNQKMNHLMIIIVGLVVMISTILNSNCILLIDFIVLLVIIIVSLKYKKIIPILLIVYLLVFGFFSIYKTDLLSKEIYYSVNNQEINNEIKEVLKKEKNIYRFNYYDDDLYHINQILDMHYYNSSVYSSLTNLDNRDSFRDVFNNDVRHRNSMILNASNNVLYNLYMGNKYLYTKNNTMYGYKKIGKDIYQNEDILPIGYATYKVMSMEHYKELEYPYNIEALMHYVVANEKRMINDFHSDIKEYSYDIKSLIKDNKNIEYKDGKYIVNNTTGKDLVLDIKEDTKIKNKILFITFDMEYNESCRIGDQYIEIMGQKNVYTCKEWKYNNKNNKFNYVISLDQVKDKKIIISKGKHVISNLKLYMIDYNDIKDSKEDKQAFVFDKTKTKGDKIVGTVEAKEYGYFVFSIPYDDGYTIEMDGKEVEYQKVDLNYIGFKITPGKHKIVLTYKAPFSKVGKILSLISFILFLLYCTKKEEKVN